MLLFLGIFSSLAMAQFSCALTCQISAKYPDVEMKVHTLSDPSAGKLK